MFKRISTLCLILLAFSVLAGADTKDYKIETGKLEGSLYKIAIPVKWNKKLLLNAHGGRPETIPISADFKIEETQNEKLLKEGWMIAETSYRRNGIFVNDGVEDLKILYDFIVKNHGKPEKTYIAGVSMGGKIVVKIAEEPKKRFDGIIAHCAGLLCEDNDTSMCENKENLKKHTFKPNIPILFYSNINELEDVKEYISKAGSSKNTALWTSPRLGHCNTNYSEALKAVKAISEWVENGRKPADETVLINVLRTDSLARHEKNGISAKVKSINVYGSLVVDVSRIDLEKANIKQDSHFQVTFKDKKFKPLLGHGYGDVAEKEWIGFITAEDYLMVAINWENAQKQLGCKEGDEIFIEKIMDEKAGGTDMLQRCNHIKTQFGPLLDSGSIPGYAIQIYHDGKMVCDEVSGFSDVASKKPLLKDSIYRIYSMSKMITTSGIMLLKEDGMISLDDKISKYLPYFSRQQAISIKELLTHTSGLTYGYSGNEKADQAFLELEKKMESDPSITLDQYAQKIADLPLAFSPGTSWDYGISTDILGRIIEVVSGKSLDVFFEERIFKPLNMKDTAFFVQAQKASRFTSLYKWSENDAMQLAETAKKSKFLVKPAFLSGGGGLVSTTDDFMKLCLMLLNKDKLENTKLLSKESVELITKNHLKTGLHPFGNQSFGFGFNVQVLIDPSVKKVPGTIGTYDWGGSAGTRFIIDPENNLVGIFMTQLSGYRSLKLDEKFRKVMYEIKGEKK